MILKPVVLYGMCQHRYLNVNIYIAHKNSFFKILSAFFESGEGAKAFDSRHLRGYRLAVEKITHISLLFFFGLFCALNGHGESRSLCKVGGYPDGPPTVSPTT